MVLSTYLVSVSRALSAICTTACSCDWVCGGGGGIDAGGSTEEEGGGGGGGETRGGSKFIEISGGGCGCEGTGGCGRMTSTLLVPVFTTGGAALGAVGGCGAGCGCCWRSLEDAVSMFTWLAMTT